MFRLISLAKNRGRNLLARFSTLRGMQRFAFTTTLALLALTAISLFTAHNGAAAGADPLAAPVTNPLPFVIGGACPSTGVLGSVVTPFCNATGTWLTNGLNYAQHFFVILLGVEFAWSAILWVLQKEQLGELLTAVVLKVMGISFFYLFITSASSWLPAIMQSFVKLGANVTGIQNVSLDPDTILNLGLGICRAVFAAIPAPVWDTNAGFFLSNIGNLIQNDLTIAFVYAVAYVFAAIIDFIIFISFLVMAGQLIMTLIEMYIMIGGGAVMLGFTGSRWTMSFGEKYIGYSFSIGVKLFVNYLILALGLQIFAVPLTGCNASIGVSICGNLATVTSILGLDGNVNTIGQMISGMGDLVLSDLSVAVTAVIFMMLSMRLPGLAASMMNGTPSLTLGAAVSAASSAMGAVTAGIGAAVQTGTSSLGAVMGAATGVADAGIGTFNEIQDNMKEVAMMAVGGGMGGGAAAGGAGGGMGSMMGGGGGGGGMGSMMGGGGGGGIGSMMGGGGGESGGGGGGESGGGSGLPGGLDKNVFMTMAKGGAKAGSAVLGGAADLGSAGINGAAGMASAAASPLMNMDEGGGGGSVAIGLKMPD
jgi:type IV secretion system protein TrbL